MRFKTVLYSLLALTSSSLHAKHFWEFWEKEEPKKGHFEIPWFTGPLLTSSAHTVPNGHINIEPYTYARTTMGVYNSHWNVKSLDHNRFRLTEQLPIQMGIAENVEADIVPEWSWTHTHGASHWALNDLGLAFAFQIYRGHFPFTLPSLKLTLSANAPVGKYDELNPKLKFTDAQGSGSWMPTISLTTSTLVHIGGPFFFGPRLSFNYTIPNPVYVRDLSIYGGGPGTRGKVFPGQIFTAQFGYEISLTRQWAFAMDLQYVHSNKTRFSGRTGSENGVPFQVGFPSSESFSIAPAIEYNFSGYLGIIAGVWFSVAGRNASEYATGIVAVNIYH